jgi:hypothetical protein
MPCRAGAIHQPVRARRRVEEVLTPDRLAVLQFLIFTHVVASGV